MNNGISFKFLLIAAFCLSAVPETALALSEQGDTRWIVEPLDYALSDNDHIGPLKAGFVCMPSGNIKWGDIRIPRDNDLTNAVLEKLKEITETGLTALNDGYRLKGRLLKFDIKLCVAGLGIGEKKPKGQAKIEVEWMQIRLADEVIAHSAKVETEFEFKGIDPRKDASLLRDGLIQNLTKFLKEKR